MHLLWRGGTLVVLSLACSLVNAQQGGSEAELSRLQGKWRVSELVDDGTVIPAERVKIWLPSGGRVEIADNGLIFNERLDGKKSIKTFSINPATYPKQIAIMARGQVESRGIYRFDSGRLVLCMAAPSITTTPTDFSAEKGSRRMMMVLERDTGGPAPTQLANLPSPPRNTTPPPAAATPPRATTPPPAAAPPAPAGLSDGDVANLLIGTWRMNDGAGLLDITFSRDGTFRSYRESVDLSTFHKVFVQSPVSSGTWRVQRGTLTAHVLASTRLDRVNQAIPLTVRTISLKDLVYADYLGRIGQATKIR